MLKRLRRWRGDYAVSRVPEHALGATAPPAAVGIALGESSLERQVRPGDPRPLQQRFHSADTHAAEAQRQRQLSELQQLVAAGDQAAVLERIGPELLAPLAERLTPAEGLHLAQIARDHERHDLAVPLLSRVAAGAEPGDERSVWAQLGLGLSYQALGRLSRARELLSDLAHQHQGHAAAVEAQLALAWLHLHAGEIEQSTRILTELQLNSIAIDPHYELDRLWCVVNGLSSLRIQRADEFTHILDRSGSDAIAAGIERIWMSRCGQILQWQGWIIDPCRQICALCLVHGKRVWRLNMNQFQYAARPDLESLVIASAADPHGRYGITCTLINHVEEAFHLQEGEAAGLIFVLTNGTQFCLQQRLEAVALTTEVIKAGFTAAIDHHCNLISANLLHKARELLGAYQESQLQAGADHLQFDHSVSTPELSVVIPLYGRIDFMEYQLNWFHAWQRRKVGQRLSLQLIYVLDDPNLKQDCLTLAKRCASLFAVPFELLINSQNLGYAGACNRGVSLAKAPVLLLLNSDVLPCQDDSLELMLRSMQQHSGRIGALGARLLFDNGAIQHDGMSFMQDCDMDGVLGRVWLNDHPLKGLKVASQEVDSLALSEREAVTGACLMVERERYEQLGGMSSHYIQGDFEDSDLCLKLRRQGLPSYIDCAATFYHLERQSMDLSSGDPDSKMKVIAANALSHHQAWCSTIERLRQCMIGEVA